MNLEPILAPPGAATISVGLAGAGQFGATFVAQARRIPGLAVSAVADRDVARARNALAAAGYASEAGVACDGAADAVKAIERGFIAVVPDGEMLAELPLDLVVEATGDPEAAARVAERAVDHGRHVAMVTKEADATVGPLLAAKARAAGRVYTPVDGDQPSLLIGLVAWARVLGFEVVSAGKAGEYDTVVDIAAGTATSWGRTAEIEGLAALYVGAPTMVETLQRRAAAFAGLTRQTVPDLCEMTVVANATGLDPDRPDLHCPFARPLELPAVFRPEADGGVLARAGTVDMFVCLRRADEASFAGGVYAIVRAPDRASGRLLAEKGLPAAGDGAYVMVHNPVHLLGMEAPLSVLAACRAGLSTGAAEPRPRIDLTARATRDLAAGTRLAIEERHAIPGLAPQMTPAVSLGAGTAVPYYLLAGSRLSVDVKAGTVIAPAMVEPPGGSTLWRLRRELDARFLMN